MARKIRILESSGGKNDNCLRQGKINGYGYIPGICYNTHDQVRELVIKWFDKKLKQYNLATAVCGYNLGFRSQYLEKCVKKSADYPYWRNFDNL